MNELFKDSYSKACEKKIEYSCKYCTLKCNDYSNLKKEKEEETNSWPSYGVSEGEERGGADECQHRSEVSYFYYNRHSFNILFCPVMTPML